MIQGVYYNPHTIRQATFFMLPVPGSDQQFPLLQLDTDSYIVGAEIQSGINFNYGEGVHCIQIGRYSALAEKITFLVNLNHDYKSVYQGSPGFAPGTAKSRLRRKGSVLIQNDVWIGHGATILSGVTIHNGAIVGAESVVTKEVPPYAIVAGNPAKIIGYRFEKEQREALNAIGWWNWDSDLLMERREDFEKPVELFIKTYQEEADRMWNQAVPIYRKEGRKNILLLMDAEEPFPVWPKVLNEYVSTPGLWSQTRLLLGMFSPAEEKGYRQVVLDFLKNLNNQEAEIMIPEGITEDNVKNLFASADYFVTTRQEKNLLWTEYACHYGAEIRYGTDIPVLS